MACNEVECAVLGGNATWMQKLDLLNLLIWMLGKMKISLTILLGFAWLLEAYGVFVLCKIYISMVQASWIHQCAFSGQQQFLVV